MRAPVMMVHGMCCTGAVWAQFRAFFETRGARVYTPTLRPDLRVRKRPPRELRSIGLDDYVAELEQEVSRIETETGHRPAVIGHSMGGLLAQALAERDRVCAAVLISPSAPAGVHTPFSRVFWSGYAVGRALGLTPRTIAPPDARSVGYAVFNCLPTAEHDAALAAMVCESGRAFGEIPRYRVDESKIRIPLLTVAASQDRLVPAALVRGTARKYAPIGGELLEYTAHAHWLYAEPGWEKPAEDIYGWLEARV